MLTAGELDVADALPVYRLMQDIAAARLDSSMQRQMFLDGMQGMFQIKLGWFCIADDWQRGGKPRVLSLARTVGFQTEWWNRLQVFNAVHAMEADPYARASMHSPDTIQTFNRHDVLPDAAAEAEFAAFVEVTRELALGDCLAGIFRFSGQPTRAVGFALHRDAADPDFSPRDLAVLRLAVTELEHLSRRSLFPLSGPVPVELSPRLQQVLDRLLKGSATKQIASDLNLSVHTVREYVTNVYEKLHVDDRAGLMSKFLKA